MFKKVGATMSERRYKHPQVNLRLPVEIKEKLAQIAEANSRSVNAEMVAALTAWVERNADVKPVDLFAVSEKLAELEKEIKQLKNKPKD
ncbi:Arc family DNA-binding protein [Shewanella algae]|uniref:Arc family DNA-binding protein n=1 Tax=Shewanella algae TaxID=38313 RepID=UPI001AAE21A6|nr:Arc family DNA-binding protein [Shewanella algae]MBO2582474.1 Arc family DNA-binding protein [Shewanella algae]